MRRTFAIFTILSQILLTSCSYRFTNIAARTPGGIRSIAVEAVYDTSREVIPHEHLWRSIQNEIARRGRLKVVPLENADALLRVEITSAAVAPTGSPSTESVDRDPVYGNPTEVRPNQFKNLRIAGSYTTLEAVNFDLIVEVYDLRKKELIFNRSYTSAGIFRSFQASSLAQTRTSYLLYEEGLDAQFKSMAQSISSKIATDLIL